jgi:hypothetical protein
VVAVAPSRWKNRLGKRGAAGARMAIAAEADPAGCISVWCTCLVTECTIPLGLFEYITCTIPFNPSQWCVLTSLARTLGSAECPQTENISTYIYLCRYQVIQLINISNIPTFRRFFQELTNTKRDTGGK